MYTPHPLPTLEPGNNPYVSTLYEGTIRLFDSVITMLKSVPVVPNEAGLFDSSGNWLTPVLSMYDVILAFIIAGLTIGFIMQLSGSMGLFGVIAASHNQAKVDAYRNNNVRLQQQRNELYADRTRLYRGD